MPGIVDSHARSFRNGETRFGIGGGDVKLLAKEIVGIETFIDLHRFAEQPGSLGSALDVLNGFNGAQEDGSGMPFPFGDDVHAIIHAVNEINIGMAGRTEHDASSLGKALGRMSGEIMWAEVSFDLDNAADSFDAGGGVHEPFSEQFARDKDGVAVIEFARQFLHRHRSMRRKIMFANSGATFEPEASLKPVNQD